MPRGLERREIGERCEGRCVKEMSGRCERDVKRDVKEMMSERCEGDE